MFNRQAQLGENIIEQSKYQQLEHQIQELCNQYFQYFVQNAPLEKSNFPLMQLTYTLWRNLAFSRLIKLSNHFSAQYQQKPQIVQSESIRIFFNMSERKYLPHFISRVESEMNIYCRGLQSLDEVVKEAEKVMSKQEEKYSDILQLGKVVWTQQLYLELIEDLLKLPYLRIFVGGSILTPRYEYATDNIFLRSKINESNIQKIANKTGKNIFNKIITGATSAIFSRTMLLRINTLFGTFNPLALGASLGISRYLQYLNKKGEQMKIQIQLKMAISFAMEKTNRMKQIYQKILEGIQKILKERDATKRENHNEEVKNLFLEILEQSWLKVEEKGEQNGWAVVNLEEIQDFQDLAPQ